MLVLSLQDRVKAVDHVVGFTGGTQAQSTEDAEENLRHAEAEEQNLRTKVELARLQLQEGVQITYSQMQYLCEEATRGECEGQRAEIFAAEIAKASAALDGRKNVNADDLQAAVILSILPRATVIFAGDMSDADYESPSTTSSPPPEVPKIMEPPPPSSAEMTSSDDDSIEENDDEKEQPEQMDDEKEDEEDQDQENESEDEELLSIPEEFMLGVANVKVNPALLQFSKWTRRGKAGRRSKIFSLLRGRFIKAVLPKGTKGKIAVGKIIVLIALRLKALVCVKLLTLFSPPSRRH